MSYIINSPSATLGGAKYILEKFLNDHSSLPLVVICPRTIDLPPKNNFKKVFHISTSGFFTHFFTLFILHFFKFKYPLPIISFTNSNSLLSSATDYTYFHNTNIYKTKNFKYLIYKYIFELSSFNTCILVQTDFTLSLMPSFFKNIRKSWPGVIIDKSCGTYNTRKSQKFSFLFSSSNLNDSNKCFEEFLYFSNNFSKEFKFFVPSYFTNKDIVSLGLLNRSKYLSVLSEIDCIFVSSISESLCLPIFEAIIYNKKIIIKNADYVLLLLDEFPEYKNHFFIYNKVGDIQYNNLLNFLHEDLIHFPKERLIKSMWGLNV